MGIGETMYYLIKIKPSGILTPQGFQEIDEFSLKDALCFSAREAIGIVRAFRDCTDLDVYKEEVK